MRKVRAMKPAMPYIQVCTLQTQQTRICKVKCFQFFHSFVNRLKMTQMYLSVELVYYLEEII